MLEMGPQEDYIETVLTCEGDFHDPLLHSRLEKFRRSLKDLLLTDMHKLILKKVEPWNSVRVTFNIPKEAALRLKQLAEQGNAALRELGVLAVQIQGDQVVSLTIAGRNNERTELILRTAEPRPGQSAASVFDSGLHSSDELNSPGPSNVEVTRKNIAEYLRQGTFEAIQPQAGPGNGVFKSPNVVATSSEPIPFRPNNVISTSPGNTSTVTSQAPMFMSNFPPGRSPTGYPASPSASYSTSPGPSRSPVHQPGLKYPSPPGIPPAIPSAPPVGGLNHVGLPPPPPYPGGATVNNIPRPGKAVSVSSPLLVNLLQTEPIVAGFSNLPGSKMLPPQEGGPPTKKRKRVKKPKEANNKPSPLPSDGEVPIQSVLNPALDAASVLSNDRVESSMDSTLAGHLADPNVSLNPSQRSMTPLMGSQSRTNNLSQMDVDSRLNPESVGFVSRQSPDAPFDCLPRATIPELGEKGIFREQHDPFPPEITAGKIINPYTGQLEPMDKSPVKTQKLASSGAPVKGKAQRIKSVNKPNRENVHDLFLSRGRKHVNKKSATVTSEDMQDQMNMAGHVEENRDLFGVSERTGETMHCPPLARSPGSAEIPAVSVAASTTALSASVPQQIYAEAQQSSQCASTAASVSTPLSSIAVPSPTQSQASVPSGMETMNSVSSAVPPLEAVKVSPPPYPTGHPVLENSGNVQSQQAQQSGSQSAELHNSDHKSPYPMDTMLEVSSAARETPSSVASNAKASPKVDSVTLLNSPSARTTDSNCISASPENKMPSEGDENSNHSGIINDITADNPTSAGSFLDSGSSKVYNHDSGVGSSSERSDDTPSEPGDSEYRTTHPAEAEELSKSQKLLDCKSESKQVTVGYVMEHEHIPQQHKDKNDLSHLPFTKEKLASLGHVKNHMNLMYSQNPSDLHPNNQVTVLQWSTKDTKHFDDHTHLANSELLLNSRKGKLKNGPVITDDTASSPPESRSLADVGHPNHPTKHPYPKGLPSNDGELNPSSPRSQTVADQGSDHPPFSADSPQNSQKQKPSLSPGELTDRTSNFQCNTSSSEWLNLSGLASQPPSSVCDTETSDSLELSQSFAHIGRLDPQSPGGVEQCLVNSDGRGQTISPKSAAEKFFPSGVDIETLQASAKGMSSKGGGHPGDVGTRSNITSKYSKRSSPVNVNMLNHIYAPGLPLPRRLTESIQRLVKPLGDPSLPQMRACKSPGASGTKHGPSGEKSPRAAHGGRSPGANVPRSSASSGVPTSQAAVASSMPSNLPNLQQNTMSGGVVSVNYNSGLPVSTTVSQTYMNQEGQSGSLMSCSGNPLVSSSDRNFYSSSQQHSTPYGTYTSPSDSQPFENSTVVASQACAATSITSSQHQELTDSVVVSNQQQTDLAEQLVPSSLSHKCNTHSGPMSQSNPPYANPLSATTEVSDICAMNQTLTHSDLIDSAASHNMTPVMVNTSGAGSNPAEQSTVNCIQSEAALTAGESHQQGANLALADGQHQSQHSTVQSAGSVEDISDAVGLGCSAQRQLQTSVTDMQPIENDSSDVPILSSVDDSDVGKDSYSVKDVVSDQENNHFENDLKEEMEPSSTEVAITECPNRDNKHETPLLCSSEAANISDTPQLISPVAASECNMNDIPSPEDKKIKMDIPDDTSVDNPPVPDEISEAASSHEPKPLKMVAELLKIPTSSCAPSLESMEIDEKKEAENMSSRNAQDASADSSFKSHINSAQPPVLEPEIDAMPTRRVTRKRKSTHSESDSNSKESEMDSLTKVDLCEGTQIRSTGQHGNVDCAPPVLPPPLSKADGANTVPRTRETRRHAHGEEKLKNSEEVNDRAATDRQQDKLVYEKQQKDVSQDKKVEGIGGGTKDDDQASKRANTGRRNKSLPAAAGEKPPSYSFFDISIIRGRTRSQSAPSTDNKDQKPEKEKEKDKEESPDSQKRSTRSSRQKDHSEQQVAKRRRSRDHR